MYLCGGKEKYVTVAPDTKEGKSHEKTYTIVGISDAVLIVSEAR